MGVGEVKEGVTEERGKDGEKEGGKVREINKIYWTCTVAEKHSLNRSLFTI